jgi:uncharacterized protein
MDRTQEVGAAPALGQERYEFLDVLRGFSLVGIVLANMISYSLYLYLPESARAGMSTAPADRALDFLELVLVEGKFYTIFSVLFGVGFSILNDRAAAKSLVFHRFFLRRAGILCLIGIAHAVFFWHNDILLFYALCGALLLPFARARDGTIVASAMFAMATPAVIRLVGAIPPGSLSGPRDLLFERFGFTSNAMIDVWADGSFVDVVFLNVSTWFGQLDYVITSGMIFRIYGCFLLGLYIGRSGIHRNLHRYASMIRRLAILGIAIGVPLNVLYARTFDSVSWLHSLVASVAPLTLSTGYACLIALLWMRTNSRILPQIFAPVGRMALTNYVGQSVVCMLIFRGTGLGLGGTIGPTFYLPLGLAIYLIQLAASRLWLGYFQFGPLEWLWRVLTYGSRIPLMKRR